MRRARRARCSPDLRIAVRRVPAPGASTSELSAFHDQRLDVLRKVEREALDAVAAWKHAKAEERAAIEAWRESQMRDYEREAPARKATAEAERAALADLEAFASGRDP